MREPGARCLDAADFVGSANARCCGKVANCCSSFRIGVPRQTRIIAVRYASLDDLESMIAVYNAAWREGFAEMFSAAVFNDQRFDEDRRQETRDQLLDDSITTLVAELDGRIIAFSGVSIEAGTPCLDDMWVHPDGWGRGAAQVLIAAIEEEQRSLGTTRLTTWVPEDGERARGFIEKMGWHPTGNAEPMGLYPQENKLLFEYDRILV